MCLQPNRQSSSTLTVNVVVKILFGIMAGGKGKKKRNSKDSTGSNGKKKGGGKKKKAGGGGGGSGKSSKIQGDIFSEGAMENAYLLCHNVQVCPTNEYTLFSAEIRVNDFCCCCFLSFYIGCSKGQRISMA